MSLFPPIRFDWKVSTITIVSTLLLLVDYYHQLTGYKPLDRMLLYLVMPILVILFVFLYRASRVA